MHHGGIGGQWSSGPQTKSHQTASMSFYLVKGKAPYKTACLQRLIVSDVPYGIFVGTVRYGIIEVNEICLSWISFYNERWFL